MDPPVYPEDNSSLFLNADGAVHGRPSGETRSSTQVWNVSERSEGQVGVHVAPSLFSGSGTIGFKGGVG